MQDPPPGMHLCPTRTDGETALIAHQITVVECQKRQREHFHKCPTCAHYNARDLLVPPVSPAAHAAAEGPKHVG